MLSKLEGSQTIVVVVDKFMKYETFILTLKDCPTDEAAKLFMRNVVKYMEFH